MGEKMGGEGMNSRRGKTYHGKEVIKDETVCKELRLRA